MAESFSEVILRYKVDRNSLTQAIAANNQVKAQLASVGNEAGQASAEIKAAFQTRATTQLSSAMKNLSGDVRDVRAETDDLRESLQGAAQDAQKVRAPTPTASGGAGNVSEGVDRGFSRVSSIVSALPGGGEIANVAGLIADVSAGFQELPKVLEDTGLSLTQIIGLGGGAGIALGALAAVISLVTTAVDQAREAEQRRIEVLVEEGRRQAELDALIAAGDVEGVQNGIAQAQLNFAAAQNSYNNLILSSLCK